MQPTVVIMSLSQTARRMTHTQKAQDVGMRKRKMCVLHSSAFCQCVAYITSFSSLLHKLFDPEPAQYVKLKDHRHS